MRFFFEALKVQLPLWFVAPLMGFVLVLGIGGGYFATLRLTNPCPLSMEECAQLSNFWRVWDLARTQYVDPAEANPVNMTDGAITGMLDSLGDQGHTRYLPPEAAQASEESLSGRFEGIGAYIDVRDNQPLIVAPIEGSPAESAGLQPGDLILQVNGEEVRGITVDELRNRVRGPRGTTVTLLIGRDGLTEPFEVTVTRSEISVPSVTWRMLPNNIAFVRLNQFSQPSSGEMRQALTQAQEQGARSLILDLRNNPGGLVNELVAIASEFLPPNTTVLLERDRNGQQTPYTTSGNGTATTIPMVVLVNVNSASSAEILAGTLKENGRAEVIGTRTFGTATVLRRFGLDGGAQVWLGTTEWLTPNGEQVRGVGIEPTELVALPLQTVPLTPSEAEGQALNELLENEDVQFVRALERAQEIASN